MPTLQLNSTVLKLGENKGQPRVWLQGKALLECGFEPGVMFEIAVLGDTLKLRVSDSGKYKVSKKSVKSGGDVSHAPVIDLNSMQLLEGLARFERVCVSFGNNELSIRPLSVDQKQGAREARLLDKIRNNAELSFASSFHGIGILDHAISQGFSACGLKSKLVLANEFDERVLQYARENDPCVNDATWLVGMGVEQLVQEREFLRTEIGEVDVFSAGVACNAHSKGRNGLAMPEHCPTFGHLVAAVVDIIGQLNPSVVVIENVEPYADSASGHILKNMLKAMRYKTFEFVANGVDYGALENRDRWALVAVSDGLDFDASLFAPAAQVKAQPRCLKDVLLPDTEVQDMWDEFAWKFRRDAVNKAAGNGFGQQNFEETSPYINTLRAGYHKNGSPDPLIINRDNPALKRQLMPIEHALIKGFPNELLGGLKSVSFTFAHQLLGQSVIWPVFNALGKAIAASLMAMVDGAASVAQGAIEKTKDTLAASPSESTSAIAPQLALAF